MPNTRSRQRQRADTQRELKLLIKEKITNRKRALSILRFTIYPTITSTGNVVLEFGDLEVMSDGN